MHSTRKNTMFRPCVVFLRTLGIIALAVSAASCAHRPAVQADEDGEALQQRERDFLAAMQVKDLERTAAYFAESAVLHVANMALVEGRAAIRQFYGNVFRFLNSSASTPEALRVASGRRRYIAALRFLPRPAEPPEPRHSFWSRRGRPRRAPFARVACLPSVQTGGIHPLTYTAPVSKAEYLGGRFFGALVLNALILLAVQVANLLARRGSRDHRSVPAGGVPRRPVGQRIRIVSGEIDSVTGEEWYEYGASLRPDAQGAAVGAAALAHGRSRARAGTLIRQPTVDLLRLALRSVS